MALAEKDIVRRDAVWTRVIEICKEQHGEEEVIVQVNDDVFLICEECANRLPKRYRE